MATGKFVSYLRVSTDKQGRSKLGLEAQREAVEQFLNGGSWTLVREFVEVETGKHADRPKLKAALAHAKATGATLVIAKLDRLSRNLAFIATLMESGVPFVASDNPHANKLTVHILAAVAQHEREMISDRTKAALAAAKRRGVKLGNPNGARALRGKQVGNDAAVAVNQAKAQARADSLSDIVAEIRAQGGSSTRQIAAALNERGVTPTRGGEWYPTTVKRLLDRLNK